MKSPHPNAEIRIRGQGVSPGIARGPAHFGEGFFVEPDVVTVPVEETETQLLRFREAIAVTKRQLEGLMNTVSDAGLDEAAILEAHLLMLEDPALLSQVESSILQRPQQAEGAFWTVVQKYADAFRRIDDDYLRERVADIEDVGRRVLSAMGGSCATGGQPHFPHILLAHDLAPSETVEMDRTKVRAFATEAGSQTSHTAILARSLGIPAVVGLHDLRSFVKSGDSVLLDGYTGVLIIHPSEETIASYEASRRRRAKVDNQLHAMRKNEAVTRDGHRVLVSSNIELAEEIVSVMNQGADGVGLYRTEFLFLNRKDWPEEEEQTADYIAVAKVAGAHGVIIRTLDIGGDKLPRSHGAGPEDNPFLGWRGLRRSLSETGVFKTQLRAILRASAFGKVRIMFPLISTATQMRDANALLEEAKQELREKGLAFDENIEKGAMIEVPSAAMTADLLAPEVDFFSIGTNDLIQYTLAVDRGNERVSEIYMPWHLSIIRLMKMVADQGRTLGKWTGVCGEMASDLRMTPLLLGLGISELSVGASALPRVKHAIRTLDLRECQALVQKILACKTSAAVFRLTREMARTYYAELME